MGIAHLEKRYIQISALVGKKTREPLTSPNLSLWDSINMKEIGITLSKI